MNSRAVPAFCVFAAMPISALEAAEDAVVAAFLEYADSTVMDHVNGSWFHQLDRTNQPIGTVWPGKSDLYHATRSMMIPLRD